MNANGNLFQRLIHRKPKWVIHNFILLDLFSVGLGMSIPFFTILLGLPVG